MHHMLNIVPFVLFNAITPSNCFYLEESSFINPRIIYGESIVDNIYNFEANTIPFHHFKFGPNFRHHANLERYSLKLYSKHLSSAEIENKKQPHNKKYVLPTSGQREQQNKFEWKGDNIFMHAKKSRKCASKSRLQRHLRARGQNHETALRLLYDSYPYLNQTIIGEDFTTQANQTTNSNEGEKRKLTEIDGKSIASTIGILGRVRKTELVSHLLRQTVQVYKKNKSIRNQLRMYHNGENNSVFIELNKDQKKDDDMILMCYRAGITAYGLSNEWKTSLHLLHHDIPNNLCLAPTVDIYHAAISAMGKNQRINEALALLSKMEDESFSPPNLPSAGYNHTKNNNKNMLVQSSPKPDRMAYHATLTALQRVKHTKLQPLPISVKNEILQILHYRMPKQNILSNHMTYNIAITACVKANDCSYALQLLTELESTPHLMEEKRYVDENTYQAVIGICGRNGRWEEAANIVMKMEKSQLKKKQTLLSRGKNLVTSNVENLVSKPETLSNVTVTNVNLRSNITFYFDFLNDFPQVGKGKYSWWELGRWYQNENLADVEVIKSLNNIVEKKRSSSLLSMNQKEESDKKQLPKCIRFGIQPHRNPVQNGISILFFDAFTSEKLGFLLIRNSLVKHDSQTVGDLVSLQQNKTSTYISALYGMKVLEKFRGLGMSNLFLSIWLKLCIDMNETSILNERVIPQTEILNKPLIAYVLQNRFGFQPMSKDKDASFSNSGGGVDVQLIPLSKIQSSQLHLLKTNIKQDSNLKLRNPWTEPKFALTSPTHKTLEGAFSERDLHVQGIIILPRHLYLNYQDDQVCTAENDAESRTFRVKSSLEHPAFKNEEEKFARKCLAQLKAQINATIHQNTIVHDKKHDGMDSQNTTTRGGLRCIANSKTMKKAFFGFLDPLLL